VKYARSSDWVTGGMGEGGICPPMKNRSRGFTLMELMIVLTVAGVILAIGAPSFGEFRRSNRMAGVANDFLIAVQVARSEAIKRQVGVSLCPSATPDADNASCTANKDFSGWIVFVDPNNNCQREFPAEQILQAGSRIDTGPNPDTRTTSISDGNCIGFAGTGFTRTAPGPGLDTAHHTLFCDGRRANSAQPGTTLSAARGIDVGQTGRARVTRDIEEIEGFDLACVGEA
jgi:type IV fimbrial biogenesis protein FimT